MEVRYPLPELPLEPPEEKYYECPICGAELCGASTVYINDNGDIVGCEDCVFTKDAANYFEE